MWFFAEAANNSLTYEAYQGAPSTVLKGHMPKLLKASNLTLPLL